jgi:hypothetical protein
MRSTTSARPQARSWRPTAPVTSAAICSLIWDCSCAVALEQKGRRLVAACSKSRRWWLWELWWESGENKGRRL